MMYRFTASEKHTGQVFAVWTSVTGDQTWKDGTFPAEYNVTVEDISADVRYVQQVRGSEYPPITDFADAYVKLQSGDSAPMNAYVAACLAVKAKYPKPQAG